MDATQFQEIVNDTESMVSHLESYTEKYESLSKVIDENQFTDDQKATLEKLIKRIDLL